MSARQLWLDGIKLDSPEYTLCPTGRVDEAFLVEIAVRFARKFRVEVKVLLISTDTRPKSKAGLTGVVTKSTRGRYVPIVTTPNRLRMFGSRCSITSKATIASYPSSLELYLSIFPSHNSTLSGSHLGTGGGKEDEAVGGVIILRAF